MNPLKWIKGQYHRHLADQAVARLRAQELIGTIDPAKFADSLRDPDAFYRRAFQDFYGTLPAEVRAHRAYYGIDRRGFGEDAFHTMWWRLARQFQPESFLEIGVYRGQVISLIALLSKLGGTDCALTGISPFSSAGDSVSRYRNDLNYLEDTLTHFRHFGLPEPTLIKALSTDPEALAAIRSRHWDMIYIDGNHDYDVVVKDWEACSYAVRPGGIIVLDDSGLNTAYHPPAFSTGGHPGPSRLASEIDPKRFKEILQVGHNRVFQKVN